MSSLFLAIVAALALIVGLIAAVMILSALWRRYHPHTPRGIYFSPAAAEWAESRFQPEFRSIAAFVAELLCEQLGVRLSQLESSTRRVDDLDMDDLEPVEVLMALEEELGIAIPENDAERIVTISEMVRYLHERIPPSSPDG